MLKTLVLIASLLFAGTALAGPQVFHDTTKCTNCKDCWVNWQCEVMGCGQCEDDITFGWSECQFCGIIRENKLYLPVGTRRSNYSYLQDDYKEHRNKRLLDYNESLTPSGWLVPSFKK